jgi:CheY-like chemotaxis protein
MPIMNGIEATLQIRKILKSKIPIIALTAYAFREDKKRFTAAGMTGYLSKPFNEPDLIDTLNKVFKKTSTKSTHLSKKIQFYDLTEIEKKTRGNTQLIAEFIDLFIQESQASLQEIDISLLNKNQNNLRNILHKLKPSLTSMGVLKFIKNEVDNIENIDATYNSVFMAANIVIDTLKISIEQLKKRLSYGIKK